jgi:hypothetical protein
MARPGRFELPTLCLEGRRSIQLSYGRLIHSKRFPALTTTPLFRSTASGLLPKCRTSVRHPRRRSAEREVGGKLTSSIVPSGVQAPKPKLDLSTGSPGSSLPSSRPSVPSAAVSLGASSGVPGNDKVAALRKKRAIEIISGRSVIWIHPTLSSHHLSRNHRCDGNKRMRGFQTDHDRGGQCPVMRISIS